MSNTGRGGEAVRSSLAPLDPALASDRVAFELGWDCAFYGQSCSQPDPEIQRGYTAGRERFGKHTQAADRFVRKWLSIRGSAWRRQRVVSESLTPEYLRRIDVTHCPVLEIELTHGTCEGTDWSIDRINNDGAYAPGNLVVMSVRANKAKGSLTFDEVIGRCNAPSDGLTGRQWLALASLMAGACVGLECPGLPFMWAHPVRARNVPALYSQILQYVFLGEQRGGLYQVMRQIDRHCLESPRERALFAALVKKMRKREKHRTRDEDFWTDMSLFECFCAWFHALSLPSLQRLQRVIHERVRQSRSYFSDDVVEGWCLGTGGYYEGQR
jgi:hypothetical protein